MLLKAHNVRPRSCRAGIRALADTHSEVLNLLFLIVLLTLCARTCTTVSVGAYLSLFSGSCFKLRYSILSTVNQCLCLRRGNSVVAQSTSWASEPDTLALRKEICLSCMSCQNEISSDLLRPRTLSKSLGLNDMIIRLQRKK